MKHTKKQDIITSKTTKKQKTTVKNDRHVNLDKKNHPFIMGLTLTKEPEDIIQ